jgi:hypothetical protein
MTNSDKKEGGGAEIYSQNITKVEPTLQIKVVALDRL